MNLIRPRSDSARLAFLKAALSSAASDYENEKRYIFEETFNQLKELAPQFERKVTRISQKLGNRSNKISECRKALKELSSFVRDGLASVRRQVSRHNLPSHLLNMYGINQDGKTPRPTKAAEWLTIGRTFVKGAEAVAQQGFPPVAGPSAKEIEEKLNIAEKAHSEISTADRAYDMEQAEIAEMRERVNTLIRDIMAELRLTLRNLDFASQRRIKRSYGAVYKYQEEDDTGKEIVGNDLKGEEGEEGQVNE